MTIATQYCTEIFKTFFFIFQWVLPFSCWRVGLLLAVRAGPVTPRTFCDVFKTRSLAVAAAFAARLCAAILTLSLSLLSLQPLFSDASLSQFARSPLCCSFARAIHFSLTTLVLSLRCSAWSCCTLLARFARSLLSLLRHYSPAVLVRSLNCSFAATPLLRSLFFAIALFARPHAYFRSCGWSYRACVTHSLLSADARY